MHWANLRAADSCAGVSFALKVPGGSRALHAATAVFHTAGVTLIPYEGNSPDAFGSGKSLTPLARMHSESFTAFSRAVTVLVWLAVLVWAAVVVLLLLAAAAVFVPLLLCLPPQPAA